MDKIRPKHYQHPSGVECIDVAIHHDFCIGNILKYLWRAGQKDNETELEDLLKGDKSNKDKQTRQLEKISQNTKTQNEITLRNLHMVVEN